jgi:hypothetical protein
MTNIKYAKEKLAAQKFGVLFLPSKKRANPEGFTMDIRLLRWDSAVGIATGYGLDD